MLLICTLLGASSGLQPESPWHSQSGQVSSRGPGPYGCVPSYFPHASHPAPPLPSAPLLAGSTLRTCTYPFLPPHSLRSPHDATSPGGLPWPHCTESHKPVHTHVPPMHRPSDNCCVVVGREGRAGSEVQSPFPLLGPSPLGLIPRVRELSWAHRPSHVLTQRTSVHDLGGVPVLTCIINLISFCTIVI